MSPWKASHSILKAVSQPPSITVSLLLVDGFPWHLFVSWNFGSKFQGTVPPRGQLPWHHPQGVMRHGLSLWIAFPSTTTQLASKGILRHLLMGTTTGTPESSFLVRAPFVASPLWMACFGTQEDGFPMNLASVTPRRIFMPCSRATAASSEARSGVQP